jgi:hypothetical protein
MDESIGFAARFTLSSSVRITIGKTIFKPKGMTAQ